MGGGISQPLPPPKFAEEWYGKYEKGQTYWVCQKDQDREIKFASKGVASKEDCPPKTMIEVFEGLLDNGAGKHQAMRVERPCPPLINGKASPPMDPSEMTTWTYQQYYDDAKAIAGGIVKLGHAPKDCVCVFGFNAPEWIIGAVAGIFAGGSFTGIYPTDTPEQINWKMKLSDSSIAFVEDAVAGEKVLETIDDLPYVKAIVYWDPDQQTKPPHKRADGTEVKLLSWEDCKGLGVDMAGKVEERMNNVKPTDVCDIIYTSGTTGNPKGVMISHDNVVYETTALLDVMKDYLDLSKQHRTLSYLPLSHIAGSLVDIFLPLFVTEKGSGGHCATFARPYDLKAGSLADRLRMTRPTVFMGVPRVWEKVHEKLVIIGKQTKGLKKKLVMKCKQKALIYAQGQQLGNDGTIPPFYGTAKKLVLNKIKDKLGLDCCDLGYSGAAPLKRETAEFFGSLGILINEVYGMSETTGCSTLTAPKTSLWGTVGFPLPGCEVEVFKVDPNDINKKTLCPRATDVFNQTEEHEGEVCFRGRHIMLGYMANPKLGEDHMNEMRKKNAETIDDEGWLHSGDMGVKGVNDMLRICGRYKELIIGAGGENIAPVPIEDNILKEFNGISSIMMIGDQRKFNTAIITLKADGATGELPGSDNLDPAVLDISPGVTTITQACKDKVWIEKITQAIKATNANGAVCPSNASKIQKFTIIPGGDFSVITGELTPTLKLKRGFVEKKHLQMIDKMYESKEMYVPYE